jgi:hypothetical protein
MLIAPSLIGVPVAFFPVPIPQTDFFAEALPVPTPPAAERDAPPVVQAVAVNATTAQAANTSPAVSFLDLILPPFLSPFATALPRESAA